MIRRTTLKDVAKKDEDLIAELSKIDLPFVIVGRPETEDKYYWVNNDNIQASEKVVDYLIGVINGQIDKYQHTIVPTNIIERDSCKKFN